MNININYISNFNPSFYKNFNNFKNKNKKKIICRNFFLFLFLVTFFKNSLFCDNVKVFVKPKKKFFLNILRAPYKNKLSKHQIGFCRYFINFKFCLNLNLFFFDSFNHFFFFVNKFNHFFNFFETNLVYSYKINFRFKFNLVNFFKFQKLK